MPARSLTLFLVLALGTPTFAVTLSVPKDHATIQAAVDASGPGDVIQIKGTYNESVLIDGKTNLSLVGKGKAQIDGGFIQTPMVVQNSQGILLEKLRFVASSDDGLRIIDSTDVHVLKCRFEDHFGNGINTEGGSDIMVEQCRFLDIGVDGLTFSDDLQTPTVDSTALKNKFKAINDDAIETDGLRNRLEGNKITLVNDDGLDIDGDENEAIDNKISKVGDEGIEVDGDGNRVEGNKISKINNDGVDVTGSDNVIRGNKISKTDSDGVDVLGSNNVIEGNKISKTFDGVEIGSVDPNSPPATGNIVDGNSIKRAFDDGVYMGSGGNTIRNNKTSKSGGIGLFDESQTGTNVYENNDFDGELIVP